jgi:hypothetical protein
VLTAKIKKQTEGLALGSIKPSVLLFTQTSHLDGPASPKVFTGAGSI